MRELYQLEPQRRFTRWKYLEMLARSERAVQEAFLPVALLWPVHCHRWLPLEDDADEELFVHL